MQQVESVKYLVCRAVGHNQYSLYIVPQCTQVPSTVCTSEVAIGVVATILIECLLAAPIIAVVLALCWKRR